MHPDLGIFMDDRLAFPLYWLILLLFLPLAFAYLFSLAGVAWMCLRRLAARGLGRPHARHTGPR
jgi:hypothetical protein